jgi:hypothetical protein
MCRPRLRLNWAWSLAGVIDSPQSPHLPVILFDSNVFTLSDLSFGLVEARWFFILSIHRALFVYFTYTVLVSFFSFVFVFVFNLGPGAASLTVFL